MSLSLPSDKLLVIQQLALFLLQTQPSTVYWDMSFFCISPILCQQICSTLLIAYLIQSDMLNVYHSPAHLIFAFHFFLVLHQLPKLS